jgi:hypothetical protein
MVDVYEKITWEEWQSNLHPLPILPNSKRLICWQKRFDISERQMFGGRLLVLRNSKDGVPIPLKPALGWAAF